MQQTWEMIPKSQDDNSLITDAIADAIDDHNNDVDAHLGPNQAMQSHRAAEIIDHLAESVVNDKLKPNARTYVAIVDNNSPADYDNIEDALDYANNLGGGTVFVRRGNYTPSRQLKFKYGVDLIGEGPGETVIIRTAGINDYMALDGSIPVDIVKWPTVYLHEGSDQMECDNPPNLTAYDLDNAYIELPNWDGYLYPTDGDYYLYSYYVAEEEMTLIDVNVQPVLRGTAGQTTVSMAGWKLIQNEINPDGLILMSKSGNTVGAVDSYDGAGTFTMSEPLAADIEEIGLSFAADGGRMSRIESVTINCAGLNSMISATRADGRAYLRDCSFTEVKQLTKGNLKNVTIEDTNIEFIDDEISLETGGAIFRNCRLTVPDTATITDFGGDGTVFENCEFYGGPLAGQNIMPTIAPNTQLNGCYFQNCLAGYICNYNPAFLEGAFNGPSFIGCRIFNSSSGNILFTGAGISVIGCKIYSQTSSYVGFPPGNTDCNFSGNIIKGTKPTDVTNNVYGANRYYT